MNMDSVEVININSDNEHNDNEQIPMINNEESRNENEQIPVTNNEEIRNENEQTSVISSIEESTSEYSNIENEDNNENEIRRPHLLINDFENPTNNEQQRINNRNRTLANFLRDAISKITADYDNFEKTLKAEKPSFSKIPKLYGTTYQQSAILYILQDLLSPNIIYTCGNNHFVNHSNTTSKENISKEKRKEEESSSIKKKKAQPIIPLTILPIEGSNKYYCGFFFQNQYNSYFNKIPKQDLHIDLLKDEKRISEGLFKIFI